MPVGTRKDPYINFMFMVEIDGIAQAGFSECIIGDTTIDSIEYREGNEPTTVRKLSGLTKYGNIILKWGITDSMDLYNWIKKVIESGAEGERKNMSIIIMDEAGNGKVRWDIVNAWPVRYKPSDLKAKGNEVSIETIEIAHEGLIRVS
ncbi:MAG: phage tail protein [Nitrospirae bacterium]|nr:phage tail protein [Nitrospirota bacterium]